MPAAALASANDTDDGSLWKLEAVLSAACFSAHVVPCAGVVVVVVGERAGGGGAVFPIPSPGTDIPAAPSRLMAPWFKYPPAWLPPVETGLCVWTGDAFPLRGGSLGGNEGGPLGFLE